MSAPTAVSPTDAAAAPPTAGGGRPCSNCGTPLLGPHCYACGQPVKGLVRHFTSFIGDFFDSVFDLDARTWRTLGPLLVLPGHLSCEYFEGRRVRYVSPVRLFFFLCIAAFFALQLTVTFDAPVSVAIDDVRTDAATGNFATMTDAAKVRIERDRIVGELRQARREAALVPGMPSGMDAAIAAVEQAAEERLAKIEGLASTEDTAAASQAAAAAQESAPAAADVPELTVRSRRFAFPVDGKPWHPDSNPLVLDWLPAFANGLLNRTLGRVEGNAERIEQEPSLLLQAFLENLPVALFLLLPVFALLLKLFFLFKRRLYMEHLIVALHSHAFLCASLLLLAGCMALRQAVPQGAVHGVAGAVQFLLLAWMPLYLLVMQRRVYRQNWVLTFLKFCVLGVAYAVLLSLGTAFALMISLVTM